MLVGESGAGSRHCETEELGRGAPELGLVGVQRYVVDFAGGEKVFEVAQKRLDLVGISEPIVYIVGRVGQILSGDAVRSLGLGARVLLAKRQHGRLH